MDDKLTPLERGARLIDKLKSLKERLERVKARKIAAKEARQKQADIREEVRRAKFIQNPLGLRSDDSRSTVDDPAP